MTRGMRALAAAAALALLPAGASARDWRVCPAAGAGCDFAGDGGIQSAVDAAANGDTIRLAAGRYAPRVTQDIPFADFILRSWILIRDKQLTLVGGPGVVLDGKAGIPATAIAVQRADVTIRDLRLSGFRWAVEEDDYYDGHGIFVIDGRARIDGVTLSDIAKMAVVARGQSSVDIVRSSIVDGHIGVWLHENAAMRLRDTVFRNNASSAVAAYDDSIVQIANSRIEASRDDGLYTEQAAYIVATNSLLLNNGPVAVHAAGGEIRVDHSLLWGNATDFLGEKRGRAVQGRGLIFADPATARAELAVAGDPALGPDAGKASAIGPGGGRRAW